MTLFELAEVRTAPWRNQHAPCRATLSHSTMLLVDDSPAGSCSTCPGSTLVSVTALHLILFPVEACCESGDDWGTVTKPKDDKRFIFSRAGRDRYYRRANVAPQVLARVKQKTRSPLSNTTT